ncbi:MAG TPA: aminodeoxychorismate/anthranilate synthase component II [Ignavibacteriaceae bacterium]|nr:aminodeoxychorismate/anthranilate synthase component II [Ignavibacteriaceae bacterium]
MKILVIDNYDSFTYNLVQLLDSRKNELVIKRNDEISIAQIRALTPAKILISPGPGRPEDAGISCKIIKTFGKKIPILGVCLGLQAIGVAFGSKVTSSKELVHGKTSKVNHDGKTIFQNIPQHFEAMRYHSLSIVPGSIPEELEVSANLTDETIMAIRHKKYKIEGVQFHPESILTKEGEKIINNWLNMNYE